MAAVSELNYFMFSRPFPDLLRRFFLPSASFARKNNSAKSFKFDDLKIEIENCEMNVRKPELVTSRFGEIFSHHMFQVKWTHNTGWDMPKIKPLHPFRCHPGSMVFHHAQSVFEGMKAFRRSDGSVNLFRPKLHIERLLGSAERAALPLFDSEEFFKCLKKLIIIDRDWVPDNVASALYIRPTFTGIQDSLKIEPSDTALLYIIMSPGGPYCKLHPVEPISLLADPTYVRAWPSGVGDVKMACNYAPTLYVHQLAKKQGLDDVLFLFGDNHQVSEGSGSHVFFFFQKGSNEFELTTPALDGTILPGITRQCFLEIAKQYNKYEVTERAITMDEVVIAAEKKALKEVFICGTAVTLCPVYKIRYLNKDIKIPITKSKDPLFLRLHKSLTDIQYGRVESDWTVKIP